MEEFERLQALLTRVEQSLAANEDRFMEMQAVASAHLFLLEQMYSNAFLGSPENFEAFMTQALDVNRAKPTLSGPMSDEYKTEMQARIAVRLQRFADAVRLRLKQGVRQG